MSTKLLPLRHSAVFIASALALAQAHATYTVIDDDLYPTKAIMARDRGGDDGIADTFKVIFVRGASLPGPSARMYLDDLIPRAQSASRIRVTGRSDAAAATKDPKQRDLAMARAAAIRSYLIKAGIAANKIDIETDTSGNPGAARGIAHAEVETWSVPTYRERSQPERAIPRNYRYLNQDPETAASAYASAPVTAPTATSGPSTPADDRLLQFINKAVQNGQMSPAVAAQILSSLVLSGTQPSTSLQTRTPDSAPVAIASQAAPSVQRWKLDARLTLKDNLDEWAKASGWQPTAWEASNFYQVTQSTTLEGAFPDVLKRIADSTGLNICAYPREQQVRVTDANVSCRK